MQLFALNISLIYIIQKMFKGHFHKITLNMLKSDITLLNNFAVHLIFHVLPEMEYFTG